MLLAVCDLLLICGAALACSLHPTRTVAWLLVVCSALWLPLNNGHAEGPVLITVDPNHGLTAADLIGYGGWVLAAWTLHRARRGRATGPGWVPLTTAVLVLACGIAVSYFVQPTQSDDRFHRDRWHRDLSTSARGIVPAAASDLERLAVQQVRVPHHLGRLGAGAVCRIRAQFPRGLGDRT